MTTLIIENTLSGHRLEYLNYLYKGAIHREKEKYIFAVPKNEWLRIKDNCDWPSSHNVSWIMLDDKECERVSHGGMLKKSYILSKFIKTIAIKERVDKVLLISLASTIPFLPIILPRKTKLSGIIYKIYLRSKRKKSQAVIDWMRYKVMSRSQSVEKVYILNDPRSSVRLNRIFNTNRFVSLADPVPCCDNSKIQDLRGEMQLSKEDIVFLHFGAMDLRKGTLEILAAINLLSDDELIGKSFIFAGKVNSNIKDRFYQLVESAVTRGAKVIVKDEFCSYALLFSLCKTSDCIVIPYHLTDLSSGALGYAAVFRKPVIGPSSGLIGELICDNNLGKTINEVTPENIKRAILDFCPYTINTDYRERNSVEAFQNTILK